jgi:biotin carboxylase
MKSLLLLGAGLGSPDVVSRLKDLGLKIVLVELKDVFDRKRACNADEIIITDYRLDSFVDFAIHLRNIWHYDHVLAISEFGVAVAARLNKLLGLRGSDVKSISLLNDKRLMRERLASSGFSHIAYKQLKTAADIRQLVDAAGWPIIIKPQNGAGSRGIHLAHSFEDAEHAFFELRACGETVLAEEYVDGKEYSVETFSFDSRHSVVAITEKIVNEQFIEVGHVVPAMLDAEAAARVGVFVQEFLSIMGVTNGPCHTEMKIGSKGMKIIESHNRFGGGNIPRLVELAYAA